jgi:hypothetical protein
VPGADADPARGTIALVIQAVGKSTRELVALEPGDAIQDISGPLGHPTEMLASGRAVCVGGGVGSSTGSGGGVSSSFLRGLDLRLFLLGARPRRLGARALLPVWWA